MVYIIFWLNFHDFMSIFCNHWSKVFLDHFYMPNAKAAAGEPSKTAAKALTAALDDTEPPFAVRPEYLNKAAVWDVWGGGGVGDEVWWGPIPPSIPEEGEGMDMGSGGEVDPPPIPCRGELGLIRFSFCRLKKKK